MYGHPPPNVFRIGPAAEVVLAHHTPQTNPVRKTTYIHYLDLSYGLTADVYFTADKVWLSV